MADAIVHNTRMILNRLNKQLERIMPGSKAIYEAMTKIGLLVTARAKVNVRRARLIDTGRLINSIRYEFFREGSVEGVRVGSFNVPYAAVHEFGFKGRVTVREHWRKQTSAWGHPMDPRNVQVKEHSRKMNIRATRYLGRAVDSSRVFILDTLRTALQYTR